MKSYSVWSCILGSEKEIILNILDTSFVSRNFQSDSHMIPILDCNNYFILSIYLIIFL